jgi:hypothetical protein
MKKVPRHPLPLPNRAPWLAWQLPHYTTNHTCLPTPLHFCHSYVQSLLFFLPSSAQANTVVLVLILSHSFLSPLAHLGTPKQSPSPQASRALTQLPALRLSSGGCSLIKRVSTAAVLPCHHLTLLSPCLLPPCRSDTTILKPHCTTPPSLLLLLSPASSLLAPPFLNAATQSHRCPHRTCCRIAAALYRRRQAATSSSDTAALQRRGAIPPSSRHPHPTHCRLVAALSCRHLASPCSRITSPSSDTAASPRRRAVLPSASLPAGVATPDT